MTAQCGDRVVQFSKYLGARRAGCDVSLWPSVVVPEFFEIILVSCCFVYASGSAIPTSSTLVIPFSRIWRVPQPARSSTHPYKYRLAYIANQRCVLRFDNEAGKGDHKHVGEREVPYRFTDVDSLQSDFWAEVKKRRRGK